MNEKEMVLATWETVALLMNLHTDDECSGYRATLQNGCSRDR
jgi:hypothetical protein